MYGWRGSKVKGGGYPWGVYSQSATGTDDFVCLASSQATEPIGVSQVVHDTRTDRCDSVRVVFPGVSCSPVSGRGWSGGIPEQVARSVRGDNDCQRKLQGTADEESVRR